MSNPIPDIVNISRSSNYPKTNEIVLTSVEPNIRIIDDRDEWSKFIALIGPKDFYYTYYYHFLSKRKGEKPVLIIYGEGNTLVALPLLLREIEGTSYSDATSVYGYAGPLCLTEGGDPLAFDPARFSAELNQFLMERKIVSVFTRLHPYIGYQKHILKNMGRISSPGEVVNIDLTLPPDIQRQQYNKRLKTYVNKARRLYNVHKATDEQQIEKFIELYYGNMQRIGADPYYFFDQKYFYQLMISSFFKVEILMCSCKDSGEYIGGAMFVKTDDIVQYHLSGCKEEYLHLNPIKLLIDEMRLRATEEGFTYFNLGGGKGIKHDSLFRFKASFSKDHRPAQFWKHIVNQEVYDKLVAKSRKDAPDSADATTDFFPAYRMPDSTDS